ncbi:MAG: hypothetical protein ACOZNI_37365 [Myxococcota bacterium]
MRFPVAPDGSVTLPASHPLLRDGRYAPAALVELAAQLAGRAVAAPAGHRGMLVEVQDCALLAPASPGERVDPVVTLEHRMGGLHRFRVVLAGHLDTRLTLRVTE